MKFDRRFFSNLLVFILLIIVGIVISTCQASNAVQLAFGDDVMAVSSKDYRMNIQYTDVEALELVEAPDLGEVVDGKNRPELKSGLWKNEAWGEYCLCFNPNATNCIVVHLNDGQTCVFNYNTNEATAETYQEFLTHLPEDTAV